MWPLACPDGTRLSVARLPHAWLVLRAGRPVLLAEGYGRQLTPLAGFEPVDVPGVVHALQAIMERPLTLRPVRRLEVERWDGQPVRDNERRGRIPRRRLHARRLTAQLGRLSRPAVIEVKRPA